VCDTVVAVGPDGVWLAKNSDREPGEAQVVEHLPPRRPASATVRCTHVEVPEAGETFEVVISRPFWMWGAEMGVNERGVAIGNEAVFTKERLDPTGLTGMDLLRLALERAPTAREAVDVMTGLLEAHGQGGRMGYRHAKFSYSSSFLVADPTEAWVLETAGRRWAAQRVQSGVRSISNGLTVREADLTDGTGRPDFAGACERGLMTTMAGARGRSACTTDRAGPDFASMAAALRDHGGRSRSDGMVMRMPCAHASFLPTRTAGQTTGSLIAHLSPAGPRAWLTGTSSPCLSVFKPVPLGTGTFLDPGPVPDGRWDDASLFWRHERLHRRVMDDEDRAAEVRARADELEAGADVDAWAEHRAALEGWLALVPPRRRASPTGRYWARQRRLDAMPA
jgi:dipeptidase